MLYATAHANPGEPIRLKFQQLGIDPALAHGPGLPRQQHSATTSKSTSPSTPGPTTATPRPAGTALWMGVPVVSLVGQTSVVGRGDRILSSMDLTELLADSLYAYVAIATNLAHRPRSTCRCVRLSARMRRSPLMDAVGFTQDVGADLPPALVAA